MRQFSSTYLISVFVLLMIWCSHVSATQSSATDSLQNELRKHPSKDTARIPILKELSSQYLKVDAYASISFLEEAVSIAESSGQPVDPLLYQMLGYAYDRIPDHNKALDFFMTARRLAEEQQDNRKKGVIDMALGWHYYRLREMNTSLNWFYEAMDVSKSLNDTAGIRNASFGLGVVYGSMESWDNMYHNLSRFISLADAKTDQRWVADSYRLIGEYHRLRKEFQDALDFYHNMFDVASAVNDSSMMGVAINHMAWTYYEMGDLDRSLEVYRKNFEFTLPQGRQQTLANIYGNIGNIYRDLERYPEALENYEKSAVIAREVRDIFHLEWVYKDISLLYARMGDYKAAYENYQLHSLYSDSLMSRSYQEQLFSTRMQYEAAKKAQDLELLKLRLERNRYLIWGLVAGIGLLIILGTSVILRFRFRNARRLEAMDRKILELTQANLRQQMNPHFIFNTLNSIQYYVFQNDKIASNNYMTKFAALIRKTLENSMHTAIPIKEELDALQLYLELEELRFKEKFEWQIDVDDDIDTLSYKIPTMLIQPYVENAISHGLMNKEEKGRLTVKMELQKDVILCTIEDDGIGRDKAREINNERSGNHLNMGTSITENRLKLVNEVYGKTMKVNYTDLRDESGEAAGTRVEITIPIIT